MGEIARYIFRLLEHNPGLSDGELSAALRGPGASLHYISQSCKDLESQSILCRKKREDGLIGNWLKDNEYTAKLVRQTGMETRAYAILEKKIKQILESYLTSRGWKPEIVWGIGHGIDIESKRGNKRWIIQVKGPSILRPINANVFLSVLGEVLQRMDDPNCRYSIALPDIEQFRRLWERLPGLAKTRTGITALFVKFASDTVEEVK
jgi:hypothetical protein